MEKVLSLVPVGEVDADLTSLCQALEKEFGKLVRLRYPYPIPPMPMTSAGNSIYPALFYVR